MFNYNLHLWAFGRFFFGWLNQGLLKFVFIPTSDSVKVLKCPLPRCWTLFFIFLDKLCSWNFCLTCSQDWDGRKLLEILTYPDRLSDDMIEIYWNDLQWRSRREMLHRMDIWPDMDVWCLSANDQNISDWHSRTSPIHFLPKIAGHSGESKPREFHFWVHSVLGYPKVTELPNSKVNSTWAKYPQKIIWIPRWGTIWFT